MLALWQVAVEETRAVIDKDWPWAASDRRTARVMLGFVIQRLLQAVVVMLVISALVFVGVYRHRQPDRRADLARRHPADPRATRSRATASTSRSGSSI